MGLIYLLLFVLVGGIGITCFDYYLARKGERGRG